MLSSAQTCDLYNKKLKKTLVGAGFDVSHCLTASRILNVVGGSLSNEVGKLQPLVFSSPCSTTSVTVRDCTPVEMLSVSEKLGVHFGGFLSLLDYSHSQFSKAMDELTLLFKLFSDTPWVLCLDIINVMAEYSGKAHITDVEKIRSRATYLFSRWEGYQSAQRLQIASDREETAEGEESEVSGDEEVHSVSEMQSGVESEAGSESQEELGQEQYATVENLDEPNAADTESKLPETSVAEFLGEFSVTGSVLERFETVDHSNAKVSVSSTPPPSQQQPFPATPQTPQSLHTPHAAVLKTPSSAEIVKEHLSTAKDTAAKQQRTISLAETIKNFHEAHREWGADPVAQVVLRSCMKKHSAIGTPRGEHQDTTQKRGVVVDESYNRVKEIDPRPSKAVDHSAGGEEIQSEPELELENVHKMVALMQTIRATTKMDLVENVTALRGGGGVADAAGAVTSDDLLQGFTTFGMSVDECFIALAAHYQDLRLGMRQPELWLIAFAEHQLLVIECAKKEIWSNLNMLCTLGYLELLETLRRDVLPLKNPELDATLGESLKEQLKHLSSELAQLIRWFKRYDFSEALMDEEEARERPDEARWAKEQREIVVQEGKEQEGLHEKAVDSKVVVSTAYKSAFFKSSLCAETPFTRRVTRKLDSSPVSDSVIRSGPVDSNRGLARGSGGDVNEEYVDRLTGKTGGGGEDSGEHSPLAQLSVSEIQTITPAESASSLTSPTLTAAGSPAQLSHAKAVPSTPRLKQENRRMKGKGSAKKNKKNKKYKKKQF